MVGIIKIMETILTEHLLVDSARMCPNCHEKEGRKFKCPSCLHEVCTDLLCSVKLKHGYICRICTHRLGQMYVEIELQEDKDKFIQELDDLSKQTSYLIV